MKCLGKFLRGQLKSQSAQARILESGAERSALGASRRGARHSTSLHYWLEFSESKDVPVTTAGSREHTNK